MVLASQRFPLRSCVQHRCRGRWHHRDDRARDDEWARQKPRRSILRRV